MIHNKAQVTWVVDSRLSGASSDMIYTGHGPI